MREMPEGKMTDRGLKRVIMTTDYCVDLLTLLKVIILGLLMKTILASTCVQNKSMHTFY